MAATRNTSSGRALAVLALIVCAAASSASAWPRQPPPSTGIHAPTAARAAPFVAQARPFERVVCRFESDANGRARCRRRSAPGTAAAQRAVIADETRPVLGFGARADAAFHGAPLLVPAAAVLTFGYGIAEAGWRGGAVNFRVWMQGARAGDERSLLFERSLDPARPDERRWFDARVDLAMHSGRRLRFAFEMIGPHASRAHAAFADPALLSASTPRRRRDRNVIVISLDTLRADHTSVHGHVHDTTPFLAELANDGAVVFEQALTTSATTPQAHMSLFTSRYPSEHRVVRGLEPLSPSIVTLPEYLRQAGFATLAVTEDGFLPRSIGFERGFGLYQENKSSDPLTPVGRAAETFADALAWLRAHRQQRFFLFVHTYQVHDPYRPPETHRALFQPYTAHDTAYSDPGAMPEHVRQMQGYDREIRFTDDRLREFIAGLRELGLAEWTTVIVTSDHGEEFMEHGLLRHAAHLYEEVLRVPLIVWGPGVVLGPRRVREPVSLIDVLPTVLELSDLPRAAGARGVSLAPTLRTQSAVPPQRVLHAEAWGQLKTDLAGVKEWDKPCLAVRGERYKYLATRLHGPDGPAFELYDLRSDPHERNDLVGTGRDPWPAGRARLQAFIARVLSRERGAARRRDSRATPEPALDPDLRARLKALGYAR